MGFQRGKCLLGNLADQFAGDAARAKCRIRDDQSPRFAHRLQHARHIQRAHAPHIQHFDADPHGRFQRLGCNQRLDCHVGKDRNRNRIALMQHFRLIQRYPVIPFGNAVFDLVQPAMFDKQDRIVILDRGNQHSFRVISRRRHDDPDPRRLREHGLQTLGMLWALPPAASHDHAYNQRNGGLAVKHVMPFCGIVD